MDKIIRTPTFVGGGITSEEKAKLNAHTKLWISHAMRTAPIEPDKIFPAIKALYAAANLGEPIVVIVPSPAVMAFAGGFASAIWHKRNAAEIATYSANEIATYGETRSATDSETRSATRGAIDTETYIAIRGATYGKTRSAIDRETSSATHNAAYSATQSAIDSAIRGATYIATRSAIDRETSSAIDRATNSAAEIETYGATRSAADSATHSAIDRETDSATRGAIDRETSSATHNATQSAIDSATNRAEKNWPYELALSIFGNRNDALFAIRSAQGWWQQYQGGNMWAAWDCYLTAARDILGLRLPEHKKYAAWEQCAIHGGFRFIHEKFCMVCDFPEILTVDDQNRPHNASGPSHRWRDGWSLYHWHGVRVEEDRAFVITNPECITAEMIDVEDNSELKRVMLERFGYERYLKETGATVVDECPADHPLIGARTGRLLVKDVGDGEQICMVDVLNSTPEPDGSVKRYMLLVDPKAYKGLAGRKVVAALASTWRNADGSLHFKRPEDYRPVFES